MSYSVTKAEFARMMGVNKSTVTRWQQKGCLVLDTEGRVMPEPSKARIADSMAGNLGVAARHAAKRGAVLPLPEKAATRLSDGHSDTHTAEEGDDTGPEDSEAGGIPMGRARYRAIILDMENRQMRLEADLRAGRRHDKAAVMSEAGSVGAALRSGLERFADVMAPRLAVSTPEQRVVLVTKALGELRRTLRGEWVRAMRRLREQQGQMPDRKGGSV